MKTLFDMLNQTANASKISGGGNSHETKHLFAIIALLLTFGVGNAWANTTHPVYCAIKPSSLGETGELYLNVHKGATSDGGVWYQIKMTQIATTIHKAETGETKDLYVASIEYVEAGLQQMEFQIYDAAPPASPRETHVAFNSWTTSSDTWTKQVFDYENENFTTYPASLTQKKSYVYFDAADWNDDVKQLVISHGTYRGFNDLNHLSNTTLYYANPDLNWGDAVCISFIGNSTSWSETGKWLNDIPLWSHHYTGYLHYSLSENSFNYFARRSGDEKGAALSYNYWGTESTAYQNLNKTQTVQARVKATGSSYSDASFASWPGSVSAERTYMSSATATTSPSAANMTSATTDAVLTSSITLTASANSGYYFEGWGDASDSNPTDGATAKTYSVTDTKTSYAFFSQTYTLTYDRKGDYSTSTLSVYSVDNFSGTTTSGSSIPTGHLITLVATPATGYEVEGWYSDAACTSAYTHGSGGVTIEGENTFKLASLNANTEVYCKFRPKNYTINLENMEATTSGTTSVDVTYNASTNMTASDPIIKPTKTNYDFGGYWVRNEDTKALVTKLIEEDGKWIKDVAGYTSHDGDNPTWVHDYAISLYAKWTETPRTITLNVSPEGAGSFEVGGEAKSHGDNITAYIATPSATITATPNPGWVFKEWQYGTNVGPYTGTGTNNTVQVTASVNGTLTAVFEPRYYLVGGEITGEGDGGSGTSSGMPGWNSYTKPFNVITSSPILATCSLTLGTNKNFYIMVRDKADGLSYGKSGGISLGDDASVKFENQDNKVLFYSNGGTNYTFKITAVDVNGRPTVSVERPHQMHFAHKRVDIDGNDHNDDLGGTLTATINGESAAYEQWFDYGSDVSWTATAETGYSLTWYTDNAYSNAMNPQPSASWSDPDITHDENIYAQFTETPTTVTLANDGHGKIQIGGVDKTETTVGVTTTRNLTAVPNDGYMFSSWTETAKTDYSTTSTSSNPTTLRGGGTGAASQTLTANFTHRWALKAESGNWGSAEFIIADISTDGSGDVIGYADITLNAANTEYQFTIKDKLNEDDIYKIGGTSVLYMNHDNCSNWTFGTDGDRSNCGIKTAGAGTYRFTWNITDKTVSVGYPTSYQVNYIAAPDNGTVTAVDGRGRTTAPGEWIEAGGSVAFTATPNTGYHIVGWYNNAECTGDPFNTDLTWTNNNVTQTQNSYAKFAENTATFTGAGNNLWSNTANWTDNAGSHRLPDIHDVLTITKPVVVDIAHAAAKRIIIDRHDGNTGKLTIQPDKGLEVAQTITLTTDGTNSLATTEADLVLESSSDGNASLVFNNTNNNQATVQMYSKATISGETWNWQYVGTPFAGSIPLYNYYGSWMYKWNNGWEVVHGSDELIPFAGYCLTQNEATTHVMGGTLVATDGNDREVDLPASTDMVLANSWTAPIYIGGFTASTFTSTPATIYLFNTGMAENGSSEGTEAGTYVTVPVNSAPYTGNELIAPMQGFFVTTEGGSAGRITMKYDELVRPSGSRADIVAGPMKAPARVKETGDKPVVLKIQANGSVYTDRVVILEREDFSTGFDNGWDGAKLGFGEEGPSLYVINGLGDPDAVSAVPAYEGTVLGFRPGNDRSFTLRWEYDGDETLYINDLQARTSTRITSGTSYSFGAEADDNGPRFTISATPIMNVPTSLENNAGRSDVRKILIDNKLYIVSRGRIYTADGILVK